MHLIKISHDLNKHRLQKNLVKSSTKSLESPLKSMFKEKQICIRPLNKTEAVARKHEKRLNSKWNLLKNISII